MQFILQIILIIHVVCGNVSLLAGTVILFGRKGSPFHRKLGRVFYFGVTGISATAFFLSVYKDIPFLFYIAVFVLYQNYCGYKAIRNKNLTYDLKDVFMSLTGIVNGFMMVKTLNIVLMIFGVLSIYLVYTDARVYHAIFRKRPLQKLNWLRRHIGFMLGAYIGTVTAFLVVNVTIQPNWVIWMLPAILLSPLILYWTKKYTKTSPLNTVKSHE